MEFNASLTVTELLAKTLENATKDFAIKCITEAAQRHGFDAENEIERLNLANTTLIRKQMAKRIPKTKATKEQKMPKEKKTTFPLPFDASLVVRSGCQALTYNHGLFTQCQHKRLETGDFCKGCQSKADASSSGKPECGTVADRIATGLFEFKDAKGRSPASYMDVLTKLKLTPETAMEEAGKLQITIHPDHFIVTEKKKEKKEKKVETGEKQRGRPKKLQGAIVADGVEDLFQQLGAENNTQPPPQLQPQTLPEQVPAQEQEPVSKQTPDKAAKEAAKAAEKAAKEAAKAAEKAAEKAAKEVAKAAEKAAKEAAKAAEKAAKEAAKAAEKAAKTAEKESKKKTPPEPQAQPQEQPQPQEEQPQKMSVKRKEINGITYLINKSTNILYTMDGIEHGLWNPTTKEIDPLPEVDDDDEIEEEEEEEEEEYDD